MGNQEAKYQPGPAFHDAVSAGLKAIGTNPQQYFKEMGITSQSIRYYTTGYSNGPRARQVRQDLIDAIGHELFEALYQRRLEVDAQK